MKKVHIDDMPWEEQKSPSGKYHSYVRNVSLALGGIRDVGTWAGGHPFDLQIRRVPPGAAVCPQHAHIIQWELFVVLSGSATVRTGEATEQVGVGEVFLQPPGNAHQIFNSGREDFVFYVIADNSPADSTYYPNSKKWMMKPQRKIFRMVEVDYFDGEESVPIPTPTPAPFTLPPAAPFRKLHLDAVPWEAWESPKKKFRGSSKELSIALGAQRNTPVGLGGHPFDLELSKLAPGYSGCPFHNHAAQWELFVIASGSGTIRCEAERHPVVAGDAILQPPGAHHQIINTGSEELTFFLIADNPPVDYWHYPDSKKWGVRSPRMFFRPNEAEYWDGEE
jgi:uncharacterized cupin superfamily protein